MHERYRQKAFTLINWLLKAAIAGFLLFTLYRQAVGEDGLDVAMAAVKALPLEDNVLWLAVAVLLLPVNWVLETQKWRALMWPFWKIPFRPAFKGVMAGISLALFTPNRIGEYGGRVLAVPARHNWHAVMATLVGNMAQLLVLIGGGLVGALYVVGAYYREARLLFDGFWWLAVALLAVMYVLFFNIHRLSGLLELLPLPVKARRGLALLQNYDPGRLHLALALAAGRYAVYSFQYFCLLVFFGVNIPLGSALAGIAAVFLIQTSLPLPPVLGLLARGEAALLALGPYSGQELSVLAASFGLFIINLCLPALVGMAAIIRINVLKSLGYEIEAVQNEPDRHRTGLPYGFRRSREDGVEYD